MPPRISIIHSADVQSDFQAGPPLDERVPDVGLAAAPGARSTEIKRRRKLLRGSGRSRVSREQSFLQIRQVRREILGRPCLQTLVGRLRVTCCGQRSGDHGEILIALRGRKSWGSVFL